MKQLNPFKWFVLQNFPFIEADFDALTNYELMCKVVEYLNATIDKVNVLGEEVQYLLDWFNNLDLQDEVDHKLDEMAESGELEELISAYLNSRAVIGFDTKSSMKSAENLAEGSICRILGTTSYSTGDGSYYRVRTLTSGDVIDDDNIVALTNFETLIAEKIPNKRADDLQDDIDDVAEDVEDLQDEIDTINADITIFIGDSYGASDMTNNWVANYCTNNGLTLGTNAFNYCTGSAGFYDIAGGDNTYLHQIQNISSSIDKNQVKKIIVAGGWNDRTRSKAQLETLVATFCTYVKSNFPNAKLFVGMIANYGALNPTETNINWRSWLLNHVLPGYSSVNANGGYYLSGVEEVMHNYSYIGQDNVHPTADGVEAIARAIKQAETTGYHESRYWEQTITTSSITKASYVSNINVNLAGRVQDGYIALKTSGSISFSSYRLINASDSDLTITLGTYTTDWNGLRYVNDLSYIPVKVQATFYQGSENELGIYDGYLRFKTNGDVELAITNNYRKTKYISGIALYSTSYLLPYICQ